MNSKPTKREEEERLLDAALEFVKSAPEEEFEELLRESGDDPVQLEKRGNSAFESAFQRFGEHKRQLAAEVGISPLVEGVGANAVVPKQPENLLAALTIPQVREIAARLGVPHYVMAGFRERRVTLESVPRGFLTRFAAAAGAELNEFLASLARPARSALASSSKADIKPDDRPLVTFEQLLTEAMVPVERRTELLRDGD